MMLRWWALCKILIQHISLTKMTRLIPKFGPNVQMIRFYWLASRKTLVVSLANGNPFADEREQRGAAPAAKGPDAT